MGTFCQGMEETNKQTITFWAVIIPPSLLATSKLDVDASTSCVVLGSRSMGPHMFWCLNGLRLSQMARSRIYFARKRSYMLGDLPSFRGVGEGVFHISTKEITLQSFKHLYTGSGPRDSPKNAGEVNTLSVLGPVGWLPRVLEAANLNPKSHTVDPKLKPQTLDPNR